MYEGFGVPSERGISEINCKICCSSKKAIELSTLVSSIVHSNFNITNFSINRDDGTYTCVVDKAPFLENQVNL